VRFNTIFDHFVVAYFFGPPCKFIWNNAVFTTFVVTVTMPT